MKFHRVAAAAARRPTQLWVMLPGAYMKPVDFIEAGFVDAVRQRDLPHDIELLEAGIDEVADGSALAFLQEFLRAQAAPASRRVALLGISLGAHLALSCMARSPVPRVHSALLLAPYLGPRDLVAQVQAQLASPRTERAEAADGDVDRAIWHWLRNRPAAAPDLYLGYGSDDRFAAAHALMARTLPAGHVDVQPGAHAWPVWTVLWQRHLDQHHGR